MMGGFGSVVWGTVGDLSKTGFWSHAERGLRVVLVGLPRWSASLFCVVVSRGLLFKTKAKATNYIRQVASILRPSP